VLNCAKGQDNNTCRDTGSRRNVSTTVQSYQRQATAISARSNNSILAVSNIGPAEPSGITDIHALQAALSWLFNCTAAGLPVESSLVYEIWDTSAGLSEHDWAVEAYKTLTSSLAFALWFFTPNSYGNPAYREAINANPQNAWKVLPSEYMTVAAVAQPSTHFVVDRGMFNLYVVLQAIPVIVAWVIYVMLLITGLPSTSLSSFPLLDFWFKADMVGPLPSKEEMASSGDSELINVSGGLIIRRTGG
jgi:hypothetical protein